MKRRSPHFITCDEVPPVTDKLVLHLFLSLCGLLISTSPALGKDAVYPRSIVVEGFLEIHIGPSLRYPVFYVAEKGEEISLIKRRTDWYKVRLTRGQEGWVHRDEIARTIFISGSEKSWRDVLFDAYIAEHLSLGWVWGRFDQGPILYIQSRYLVNDVLSGELNVGFRSNHFGNAELYLAGLAITAWQGSWLSLNGSLGGGYIQNSPAKLLINAESEHFPVAYAGLGFSMPLFRRLSLRGNLRQFSLINNPENVNTLSEYSLGVMFNF